MFSKSPLRRRPIRLLWIGQVLSAIGDQFYMVAILWLGLDLLGTDAGFLSALQAAALFAVSLFSAPWADRWDPRRTMLATDILRGVLVLAIPVASMFDALSLPLLVVTAVAVATLTGLFHPALQAAVPRLAPDRDVLHRTNALFDSTVRLARIVGPGMIGLADKLVPVVHFFTLNAATFFLSAAALWMLRSALPREAPAPAEPVWRALTAGFRSLKRHPLVTYAFATSVAVNLAWSLGFTMGMAILIRAKMPDALSAYGLFISAYGVGNIISNILVATRPPARPHGAIIFSRILFGVGLATMAFAPNLSTLLVLAVITATNGPLSDLTLTHLLQTRFPPSEISRIFRVRFVFAYAGILVGYLVAPFAFDRVAAEYVVAACGVACAISGIGGMLLLRRRDRRAAQRAAAGILPVDPALHRTPEPRPPLSQAP